ncbi:MAG: 1-phosphofructokinase family hexose kinase [Clostridia bacterium]|nr:1-phosphofructokinase family hexose kinase [Clostridia bacterium]
MKETKVITLTLNPAFDLHCSIEDFAPYQECYAETLSVDAGGKGINISRALKVNGTDSLAIVVVGAENAMEFCKMLNRDGMQYEEIWAEGRIRQNITLHEEDKPETRISFSGFQCDKKILRKVNNRVEVNENTIVTFTGSVPVGVSLDDVKELLHEFKKEGAKIVIDSRSFAMEDLLELKPWLIKPNRVEATKYLGKSVQTPEAAVEMAQKFYEGGIENAVVSLGGGGAVMVCKEGTYHVKAPKCEVISTIGAGDSLVAGFITGATKGWLPQESLRLAVACGTAACMTAGTRPPEKENIDSIFAEIQVEKLA